MGVHPGPGVDMLSWIVRIVQAHEGRQSGFTPDAGEDAMPKAPNEIVARAVLDSFTEGDPETLADVFADDTPYATPSIVTGLP